MGEAISSTIAQQLASVASNKGTTQTLTLPVLLTELPPVLNDVTRPLSINGTLIGMLSPQDMSLRTSMGAIKVALATTDQHLFTALLQTLGDKNTALPPVTLYLDKGGVSSKGLLTLPMPDKAPVTNQGPSVTDTFSRPAAMNASPESAPQTIPLGKPIQALVLTPHETKTNLVAPANSQASPETNISAAAATQRGSVTSTQIPPAPAEPSQMSTCPSLAGTQTPTHAVPQQLPKAQAVTIHEVHTLEANLVSQQPPASGKAVNAIVTGHMPSGNPVLTSGKATILLQEPMPLSLGTKLVISLTPWQDTARALLPARPNDTMADLAQTYLSALANTAAQAGQPQATALPSPSNHLTGALLFFLSALHSGKMEEWLPSPRLSAFQRSEKGDKTSPKTALIDALNDPELVQAHDPKIGQWHCYPVPLHADGFCQTLRLYVHQDGSNQEDGPSRTATGKKTRFVVTLTMSKLGAMQLDGLARPKTLDLVLRSEKQLPLTLVNEIRSSTLASFEAIGLKGSILFQSGEANWIHFHHNQPSLGVEV